MRFVVIVNIALCLVAMNLAAIPKFYAPPLTEVQKKALEYARLEPREIAEWKRKSKLSTLLPRFQVGFDRDVKNDVDVSISDSVSVSGDTVNIGPEESDIAQNMDSTVAFEVKAIWSFDKLIFNENQLDISAEARYQVAERRQILGEVNKKYYDREQIQEELNLLQRKQPVDEHEMALKKLTIKRLEADLDALTGGWFTRQIYEE